MATWKAEFLSHYYERRRRPLRSLAFGLVDRWAALASISPEAANFATSNPFIGAIARKAIGIAPQRQLPVLAKHTFRSWVRERQPNVELGPLAQKVILWPDTFNNYFHPETAQAAYNLLSSAGFRVIVPQHHFCCGRPLYDFGMLDRARRYLREIMDKLGPQIDAGVSVVVLEPSCASVFRDELTGIFPKEERARKLSQQTFLLSEFLERIGYEPPHFKATILLHGHCHHKSLMKMTAEEKLLTSMGAQISAPDTGCCGMAGPFGFEKEKYEVSQKIGERVLLPAVRAADESTLIVADGFSCREQISQATGRTTLHLAELLALAQKNAPR
jgi:Fe-S oxidoreductase